MDNFSHKDIDHTPIPQLYCTSDEMLNHDLGSKTKVPCLMKPTAVKMMDQERDCNWDKSSHVESTHRSGGPLTWQSVSTISKCLDDFPRNVPSGMDSVIGSSRNIIASTPIENCSARSRQKQFVNLRKIHDTHSASGRGVPTLNMPTTSTGQACMMN